MLEIGFCLGPGVFPARDIFQLRTQRGGHGDFQPLLAIQPHVGDLVIQRCRQAALDGLGRTGMKVLLVLGVAWRGKFLRHIGADRRHPAFAVSRQFPLPRIGHETCACIQERLVQGPVGFQPGSQQHISVAVVQKVGHRTGGIGGQSLQFFACPVVQRLDRGLGKRRAHFRNRCFHLSGEFVGLIRQAAAQVTHPFPCQHRKQKQRQHLDEHEQRNQFGADAKAAAGHTVCELHGKVLGLGTRLHPRRRIGIGARLTC